MRNFLLGLVVGAGAIYVASKLIDEEKRQELYDDLEKAGEDAREKVRDGVRYGRGRALRMGVRARKEVRCGKKRLSQAAGDLAGRLSEELQEFEEKARANS